MQHAGVSDPTLSLLDTIAFWIVVPSFAISLLCLVVLFVWVCYQEVLTFLMKAAKRRMAPAIRNQRSWLVFAHYLTSHRLIEAKET